jgi:hypothetical protein
MKRAVALALLASLPSAAAAQAVPPELAAPPRLLLAQADSESVDDSDLGREESLEELNQIEFDKDAWSMGAAVGLSFLPGAGWGLVYAKKPAAAVVPFTLSITGYVVGALYIAGLFDEKQSTVCLYEGSQEVSINACRLVQSEGQVTADVDGDGRAGDWQVEVDERDPERRTYFYTANKYSAAPKGENFDGKKTGLIVMGATYAATTLLGAAWAGLTVDDHNTELRKNIESTASAPRPIVSYDGRNGYMGLLLDF